MRSATHVYELQHTKEHCVIHGFYLKFDLLKVCHIHMDNGLQADLTFEGDFGLSLSENLAI